MSVFVSELERQPQKDSSERKFAGFGYFGNGQEDAANHRSVGSGWPELPSAPALPKASKSAEILLCARQSIYRSGRMSVIARVI